jgi:aldose sugar dehydrogenase
MNSTSLIPLGLFLLGNLVGTLLTGYYIHYTSALPEKQSYKGITLLDPNLEFKVIFKGLKNPTSMVFLGQNDILVLQKDKDTVKRIVNGNMLSKSLLEVNVATQGGRGMLGIAISKNENGGSTYVFLYFIESSADRGSQTGGKARLYRYELKDNKLIHPKLLLDVSGASGVGTKANEFQMGGKVLIGPDQNVYLVVGELSGRYTLAQNLKGQDPPDGSSGILRITKDGEPVTGGNILGDADPLNKYYAYGIRNSFGMDFDPLSGKLWDTENGPSYGDEINLVEPGFNSGWKRQQGFLVNPYYPDEFVNIGESGKKGNYSDPEFVWNQTVAPTALKFLNTDKLGKQYENDMFVGDAKFGNIYHFDLNDNRTALATYTPLSDKSADSLEELERVVFGQSFGLITDLEIGPDGYLYVLTNEGNNGIIYRIVPSAGRT